jgi:hypothetical protein
MSVDQRTSVEPVTDGQSDLLVVATKNYPGGKDKLELAKGHPDFRKEIWDTLDRLAADQTLRLPLMQRPAWKTVQLGLHRTADDYRTALQQNGFRLGSWASDIMGQPAFTVSQESTSVELVLMTVAELGFKNGAKRSDIYQRALELGFELCPSEVGPALRLAYPDQPKNEWIWIGMDPISDSGGAPGVFDVAHDGFGRWLRTDCDYPDGVWAGLRRWVFVRRK